MTAFAVPGPLDALLRRAVALLDAWSYRIARARAERRRQLLLRRQAAKRAAADGLPRWPTSWGD